MGYDVRWATSSDLPELVRFFRRAYGEATVFQDVGFISWFLGGRTDVVSDEAFPLESVIGIADRGEIVGHYGALTASLLLDERPVPLRWGVNAFTLPEHRGHGLGRALVEPFLQPDGVLGVIGFQPAVREFYAAEGFNVFDSARAQRHVLCLDARVLDVSALVSDDAARAARLLRVSEPVAAGEPASEAGSTVNLEREHLSKLNLSVPEGVRASCERTGEWLRWRFLDNPSLSYDVRCHERDGAPRACIASRRLQLKPTSFTATRIVDVHGSITGAERLVSDAVADAARRGDIYVECTHFGSCYDGVFERLGFISLRAEDVELLPLFTSPVKSRPNTEYLGLYSASHAEAVASLTPDDVHFTLADSDRDRAGRIHDLPRIVARGK